MATRFQLHEQPIIGFAATCDPDRAKRFYGETLGLRLASEGPSALVFEAGGTMLRIQIVEDVCVAGYTVLGWQVPLITAAVQGLLEAGVRFERYQGLPQDELGIWTAPDGAKVAWFEDPDGNTLSITQFEQKG